MNLGSFLECVSVDLKLTAFFGLTKLSVTCKVLLEFRVRILNFILQITKTESTGNIGCDRLLSEQQEAKTTL